MFHNILLGFTLLTCHKFYMTIQLIKCYRHRTINIVYVAKGRQYWLPDATIKI